MAITREELNVLKKLSDKLIQEKTPYMNTWKDIAKFCSTEDDYWQTDSFDKNARLINNKLFDITALEAVNTLADGIISYACGPTIDWLSIKLHDQIDGDENKDAKQYLQKVEDQELDILSNSTYYEELNATVKTCSRYGTAVLLMEWKEEDEYPTFTNLHPKDICLMQNGKKEVDTLFQIFWLSKTDAVNEFGEENLPDYILNSEIEEYEMFKFIRYIGPNNRVKLSVDGEDNWISVIWADKASERDGTVREGRMSTKPFTCWRWSRDSAGRVYGVDSPAMITLPTNKSSQILEESEVSVVHKLAHPMWVKSRGLVLNNRPDGATEMNPGQMVQQIPNNASVVGLDEILQRKEQTIKRVFYVDFFLTMMAQSNVNMTATEVQARKAEQSATMSKFILALTHGIFTPVVEYTYNKMVEFAKIEPPPDDLVGKDINIDYTSSLATLQKKSHKTNGTNEWLSQAFQIAQVQPNVTDAINFDEVIRASADVLKVDAKVMNSKEDIEKIRQARAEAQAKQQELENALASQKQASDTYSKTAVAPQKGSYAEAKTGLTGGSNGEE